MYLVGIPSDEREIRPRRLLRFRPALLPVAQRPKRNVVSLGKFLLGQVQGSADDFHPWRLLHAPKIGPRQRLRVGIGTRGLFDRLSGHRSKHFARNSRLAQFALPSGLKRSESV